MDKYSTFNMVDRSRQRSRIRSTNIIWRKAQCHSRGLVGDYPPNTRWQRYEIRSVTMETQNASNSSAAGQAELVAQVERVSTTQS